MRRLVPLLAGLLSVCAVTASAQTAQEPPKSEGAQEVPNPVTTEPAPVQVEPAIPYGDGGVPVITGPEKSTVPMPEASGAITTRSTNPTDDAMHIDVPPILGIDIRFNGYFWADTGYMGRDNAQAGQYDQNVAYLQGRFVLGAALGRSVGDYFGTAKVEFLGLVNEFARSQYEPHTLDAYARIGHHKWWDFQIGRFLAWEVYHRGQGIEFWTAEEAGALGGPSLYWLDLTRGYRNESGQAAFHLYPSKYIKFELAGVYGQENNQNNFGVRPALHLTVANFQFLAGYEALLLRPQTEADKVQTTTHGYAARAQYTFFKVVTAGVNFSQAFVNATDIQGIQDTDRSLDKYTVGGFIDIDFWRNSIGLGYHHTNQLNLQSENNRHHQAFVSYLFRLPIPGMSIKAVYGFANAHIEDGDTRTTWENYVHSVRVRIAYEFN